MFKMFEKKEKSDTTVVEKTPSTAVLEKVKEIHATFYTEVDRLLAESKILSSTASEKQQLLDKAEKLIIMGLILLINFLR